MNKNKIAAIVLITICLLIGIICLVLGIKKTIELNKQIQNYQTVDAYFVDYEIFNPDRDKDESPTYRLIYKYQVNGKDYTIKTDYGINIIPDKNETREVKYNPLNPEEAILSGANSTYFLIYFGAFFLISDMFFIMGILSKKGLFSNFKIDVTALYGGIAFIIIGIGIIFLIIGITGSIQKSIKYLGIWNMVPILFIAVGLLFIIKCLKMRFKK